MEGESFVRIGIYMLEFLELRDKTSILIGQIHAMVLRSYQCGGRIAIPSQCFPPGDKVCCDDKSLQVIGGII